jgi:hypothetical protein
MRRMLLLLGVTLAIPAASAATRAERCEKSNEELARIEEAKKRTTNEARLHQLESKRQKLLAGKAKHKC